MLATGFYHHLAVTHRTLYRVKLGFTEDEIQLSTTMTDFRSQFQMIPSAVGQLLGKWKNTARESEKETGVPLSSKNTLIGTMTSH